MAIEIIQDIRRWQEIRSDWERLAKHNAMLCFDWMFGWWQAYGAGCRLHIVVVRDAADNIVGIAPWYEHSPEGAASVRFLASGKVCSDYLEILAVESERAYVHQSIAQHLQQHFGRFSSNTFAQGVYVEGMRTESPSILHFFDEIKDRGFLVRTRALGNCWRAELPKSWDQFARGLTGYRQKANKAIRNMANGTIHAREINDSRYADQGLAILKSLHLMRRSVVGDQGCYADSRFESFLQLAIPPMLDSGKARFVYLETDGRPISILLLLVSDTWIAHYQSGMNPDASSLEPGHASVVQSIHQAIQDGFADYDFLRGDEPYKKRWSAIPVTISKAWLVPPTICARATFLLKENAIFWRNACRGACSQQAT